MGRGDAMNRKTIETVLIYDNTEEYGQIFAGILSQQGYNVNIFENNKDIEFLPCRENVPDCVIVDEGFICSENNELVRQVHDIDSDSVVIILSSAYSDSMKMKINSFENALYFSKPVDAQAIAASLKEFEGMPEISKIADSTRAAVSDGDIEELLCGLGFSTKLKGFGFLKECIYATLEKPELLGSISKKLYTCVGERIGTAPTSVEKNIRASISMAFREDRNMRLQSFVHADKCPTNGAVIKALYNYYAGGE
ncbi:MAG: sporulation initiation factor Spo0A C-terminal domain-containing protein [Oscillospiraceae bacterium]